MLSPQELNRYHRQMILPQFGQQGQEALKAARVLLIGCGGLGSPIGLYLAAAGVGTLGLVDSDVVEESNLQRQVAFTSDDLGLSKAARAAERLRQLNPLIEVRAHELRLTSDNAMALLADYDLVVDGSDNFATRYLVNDACVLLDKPLVYGSIYQFEGQASVFHHRDGPCYRCLFPEPPPAHLAPSCAEAGVLGILPAVVAGIQATEAVKVITGIGKTLSGRLLHYSAADMQFYEMQLKRNPKCPVCGEQPEITALLDYQQICSTDTSPAAGEISPQQLKQWLDEGKTVTLVDVREEFERAICAISDSVHIPLPTLAQRLEELREQPNLVLYCKAGGRSAQACRSLQEAGIEGSLSLAGGILAWAEQVEPEMARY